jgi:hypothetical protein
VPDQESDSMPIVDLYSSRQNAADPARDVWVYDQIPGRLRVQVSNIVKGALGPVRDYTDSSGPVYASIRDIVAHEHGRTHLGSDPYEGPCGQVHTCIRTEQDVLIWLDTIELSLRAVEMYFGDLDRHGRAMREIKIPAKNAVDELNERFRRAGFGYRYERGKIIRIDSELLHQEVTLPALALLSDPRFAGADQEFRAAHDHLKAGEYKDCAVDALNALESTMKAICDAKGWKYDKGARARDLVKLLRREGLFPEFAERSFDQLIATLQSGLPTVRNTSGAHGQGATPVDTPAYVAQYALNLAASKIRLLYEAFAASEPAHAPAPAGR